MPTVLSIGKDGDRRTRFKGEQGYKNLKRYYKESRDWERFRLSDGFKLLYADKLERLTEYIFRAGYALTVNGTRFDYYVADNKTADDEIPEEVKIIGTSEFLKMIDVQITDDGELKVGDDDGSANAFKRFFEQAATCSDKKNRALQKQAIDLLYFTT